MFKFNFVILLIISFITISTKVISQEINSVNIQELILHIIDPNESMSKNIENLEKINIKCGRGKARKVFCNTIDGEIILSRRGKSTTEIVIPPILFDIYLEDGISMLLDSVIDTVGESDYEMKSISGYVYIFKLSDRSFVLSLAGLVIKTLDN
jgi:hypothetical protein